MDFSHLLTKGKFSSQKLLDYGFEKSQNKNSVDKNSLEEFSLFKNLQIENFFVKINLSKEKISAEVFEQTENQNFEKYILFDVPTAKGSFIAELRKNVQTLIDDIFEKCFVQENVKKKYQNWILENFPTAAENPWDDDSTVFRVQNKKWFVLFMHIPYKKFGFNSEELVWVVNLKTNPEKIESLIDNRSIFPAWHMNKKHWITILLTTVTDFEKLCELTKISFALVKN